MLEIERQIENHKLMASWWAESAMSLKCLNRKLYHQNGKAYTDREKVYDACQKMKFHVLKVRELTQIKLQMEGGKVNVTA